MHTEPKEEQINFTISELRLQTTTFKKLQTGTHLFHGSVDGSKGRLLLRVKAASVPVQNCYAFFVCTLTYTHIHAVVRSVVVPARVNVQLV
jgi:hypothetical protein